MKNRFLLTALIAALLHLAFPAHSQEIGVLNLTPLHLQFPATWQFHARGKLIEGKGANGEIVLVTIIRRQNSANKSTIELAKDFAATELNQLGRKGSLAVVRPLAPLPAPDGKIAFSIVSEASSIFGAKKYFAQYILASDSALIYLTVEGRGSATTISQEFDSIIATQSWDE